MKKMLFVLLALLSFSLSAFAAVNINTATQAEIEGLKGIGPTKAKAIIDYRQKNGGFKSVDELEQVKGIGPATVKKLRNDITVTGKTTAPAAKAATPATPAIPAAKAKPEALPPAAAAVPAAPAKPAAKADKKSKAEAK